MESVINACAAAVQSAFPGLIYTHIILFGFSLMLAYLIYKSHKLGPLTSAFLFLCYSVAIWLVLNFIIWIAYANPVVVSAAWAPIEFIAVLSFIFTYYFIYVFTTKQDMPSNIKYALGLIALPVLVLAPTSANLSGYNYVDCIAVENITYIQYVFCIKILLTVLSLGQLIYGFYNKVRERRQLGVLIFGIVFFLVAFMLSSYVSSVLGNYMYEIYSLFGVLIFFGCLAYLIINDHIFETRIFAAQILVATLFIVNIPSIFFVTQNVDKFIWVAESLVIIGLGYFLIQSVRSEIRQREELERQKVELEDKNQKLIELDAQKNQFLSFATHQLKAPLTNIKWGMGAMHDTTMTDEQKMIVNQVEVVAGQMVRTVNEFLSAAKLEAGEFKLLTTEMNLADMIQRIVTEFQPLAREKHLELRGSYPSTQLMANIDEVKMQQVISNLIDNAIKYTQAGSVLVTLEVHNLKGLITVSDTGAGMPPEETGQLFQKYKRGSASVHNKGGSGIGLYLAKEIVEMHHGRIWAESNGVGTGSRFMVELPLIV